MRINEIHWTNDELANPESWEVLGKIHIPYIATYLLVHDQGPTRWYIARHQIGGEQMRTVIYPGRTSPALVAAWDAILDFKRTCNGGD